MEVLRSFRYWTLWMSKRHTVSLHCDNTIYNDIRDCFEGIIWALAMKKTEWKEDLFFVAQLAWQTLMKYNTEVSPTAGMLLTSSCILDLVGKLWSYSSWDMGMDINPVDETSYTTYYQDAFLRYVENEYCAKHQPVPVNEHESLPSSNLFPSATASGSQQSSFDLYDLCNDDEEYITFNNAAEMTPG